MNKQPPTSQERQRANLRLALILASLAATFFFGFILKIVMLKSH
jgi:hypothetical protein